VVKSEEEFAKATERLVAKARKIWQQRKFSKSLIRLLLHLKCVDLLGDENDIKMVVGDDEFEPADPVVEEELEQIQLEEEGRSADNLNQECWRIRVPN
jgi:hypothetical protein